MSIPQGDLPDWQTLTSPVFNVAAAALFSSGQQVTLISSASPFRLWQLMISGTASESGAPAGGGDEVGIAIVEGTGTTLLNLQMLLNVNPQSVDGVITIPLYGYQPRINAGLYSINATMSNLAVAVAAFGTCIAVFSQP